VAMKVVRKIQRYVESADIEADIIADIQKKLKDNAPPDDERGPSGTEWGSRIVHMTDRFHFEGHNCLVFERLGTSLYDFMKANDYKRYTVPHVRDFSVQMMQAIAVIHDMNLIHTDLKPENVLLEECDDNCVIETEPDPNDPEKTVEVKRPRSTRIKLIDFGGATYDDDSHKSTIINTRQYRAPEVMLGLEWSFPADLWSLGCIIVELYQGDFLFSTHENMEHFALIDKTAGPFPPAMLAKAGSSVISKHFRRGETEGDWTLRWPDGASSSSSRRHVEAMKSVAAHVREEDPYGDQLKEVLVNFLTIDPSKRVSAKGALKMPYFQSAAEVQ